MKIQGEILHSTRNPASYKLILYTELILLQETTNYKAHPVQIVSRHPPATAPRVSKHSTRQNQGSKRPTAIQGYLETGRVEGEF